ncbi:FG-GAP repeat domain-containing protein [Lentzea sp. NEAU-D7]|uniref:FG-GAP repeat domain-containing protein n=1 Tax=Lentzea sp. NEAU-D7 TaxID=2994667 RepID=UPI00224AE8B6|nr:VCBS repeat-containing protein [Lentzea sp. NEAU-D7]MCX2954522.1 VCBS repeat-containing protein [Lentzea sp. NEAU-D7]
MNSRRKKLRKILSNASAAIALMITFAAASTPFASADPLQTFYGDYTGDGVNDRVVVDQNNCYFEFQLIEVCNFDIYAEKGQASTFIRQTPALASWTGYAHQAPYQVNFERLTDPGVITLIVSLADKTKTFQYLNGALSQMSVTNGSAPFTIVDLDYDGVKDVFHGTGYYSGSIGYGVTYLSTAAQATGNSILPLPEASSGGYNYYEGMTYSFQDVTNDGKAEVVVGVFRPSSGSSDACASQDRVNAWRVYLNQGQRSFGASASGLNCRSAYSPTTINSVQTFDSNNDGRMDIQLRSNATTVQTSYGRGTGDFNASPPPAWSTRDKPAIYDPPFGVFTLRPSMTDSTAGQTYSSTSPSATTQALICDWDGNGTRTPGRFDNGSILFSNTNTGSLNLAFTFGATGDRALCGDWNGDGIDTIGVFKPSNSTWYLRNSNSSGAADISFATACYGTTPVAGDWNGDGIDTVGCVMNNNTLQWGLRNSHQDVNPIAVDFGQSGDVPVVGDWDGNGIAGIGVYRPSTKTYYLRDSLSTGAAQHWIKFGNGDSSQQPLSWR